MEASKQVLVFKFETSAPDEARVRRPVVSPTAVTPLFEQALMGQLDNLDGNKIFSTNHARAKLAAEKAAEGVPVIRHRNGKIDMSVVLDDGVSKRNVCRYCHHTFSYPHVMERHIKRIHEKHLMTKFKCPKCSYTTVWKDQMREHFSVIHQNFKPYFCTICNFRAPKPCRVTAHINRCHAGVGSCSYDSDMRPRSVSPTPVDEPSKSSSQKSTAGSKRRRSEEVVSADFVFEVEPKLAKPNFDEELQPEVDEDFKIEIKENLGLSLDDDLLPDPNVDEGGGDEESDDDDFDGPCFHCPFCDFMSKSQLEMGEHVIETHERAKTSGSSTRSTSRSNQLLDCQVCGRKYQTPLTLEQHYKKDHPDVSRPK